jgi:putative ABC transport system permease protein
MAWRDTRRSRRHLLLYAAAIIFGVAALVAIGSLGRNLEQSVETQAKTLLGADLALISRESLADDARRFVESLGGEQSREISFSSMAYFPKSGSTRLVQVRALEPGFPFYGAFETAPASASREFRTLPGALVEESVMKQFGLAPG